MSEHLQNPEHINVSEPMMEIIEEIAKKSPNVIIATIGPVEVDLDQEEDDEWEEHGITPVVIAETRHIDIDTNEVVAQSDIVSIGGTIIQTRDEIDRSNEVVNYTDASKVSESLTPPTSFDFSKVNSIHTYEEHVSDVNTTLQGIGTATTEDAYTYGINRLKNNKKPRPTDWIVGHIFGPSYDLWISEYDETNRIFFGFASFGGISDYCAEWGSVSIDELLSIKPFKLERDFYWTPTTLESLQNHHESKEEDAKEQALAL